MQKENKIFLAIIIGAAIIGVCVYLGLQKKEAVVLPLATQSLTPAAQKPNSVPVINKSNIAVCGASSQTIVTKVIDGDTVVVEGGYHVRLLEMDADEKGYPCYDQAKTGLESLVLGKQVVLEKDKTDLDQYGRCLRYIFLGNTNVDVQLVKDGLAVARFYEPDVKYETEISTAEQQAQETKVGCKWSGASQTAK
jgi:endonuclease YncB( thermonuclease family)